MINSKEVKARKDYVCEHCKGIIRKGEIHIHHKAVFPKYADGDDEKQIGIEYYSGRTHGRTCQGRFLYMTVDQARIVMKKCDKGIHDIQEAQEVDHYVECWPVGIGTGEYFCTDCGKYFKNYKES